MTSPKSLLLLLLPVLIRSRCCCYCRTGHHQTGTTLSKLIEKSYCRCMHRFLRCRHSRGCTGCHHREGHHTPHHSGLFGLPSISLLWLQFIEWMALTCEQKHTVHSSSETCWEEPDPYTQSASGKLIPGEIHLVSCIFGVARGKMFFPYSLISASWSVSVTHAPRATYTHPASSMCACGVRCTVYWPVALPCTASLPSL